MSCFTNHKNTPLLFEIGTIFSWQNLFLPYCLPVGRLTGSYSTLADMFINIKQNQLTRARLICLTSALENWSRKAFLETDSKQTCIVWWFEREPDEISLASLKLAYVNALQVQSGTSEKLFVVLQKTEVWFGWAS